MQETKRVLHDNMMEQEEEAKAEVEIWNYILGSIPVTAIKCAIELKIADALEKQYTPVKLSDLSHVLGCKPSPLYRIMRYLVHLGIFKEENTTDGSKGYVKTPLSRKLIVEDAGNQNSMAAFILMMNGPVMLSSLHHLSRGVVDNGGTSPFKAANGEDLWSHTGSKSDFNKLFNDSIACDARMSIPALLRSCPHLLQDVGSLVDVGGGNGTTLRILLQEFPCIQGINFDLPHVISEVTDQSNGILHVGGNMFESVPKADAAILKYILHDWGDDESIHILKKCKEAISKDKGKVIILDSVIEEQHDQEDDDKLMGARLMMDIAMLAHTNGGKERTLAEWQYVLGEAGFSHYTVKGIQALQSVIVAYP